MSDNTIRIEIPYMPPVELRNNGGNAHWAAKLAAAVSFREDVFMSFVEALGTPEPEQVERVRIRYEVHWCGSKMDEDGFISAMKYAQDVLTPTKVYPRRSGKVNVKWGIGLIADDDKDHITGIEVEYVRVEHRDEVKVVMEVIPDG